MTELQQTQLARAIEIAKEKGHKVFTATHRASGATVYTVRSASDKNLYHVLFIQDGRIHCDCYCSQQGRICSHSAAVRLFLIAQRAALASVEAEEAAESSCATVEAEISRQEDDQAMERRSDVVDRKVAETERIISEQEWTPEPEEEKCCITDCINPCKPGYYVCEEHASGSGEIWKHESADQEWGDELTCSLCGGMLVNGTCREGICARYGLAQRREMALPAQATDDQPFSLYKSE